jgi:hypothetical protein
MQRVSEAAQSTRQEPMTYYKYSHVPMYEGGPGI